mgnify:CR=1 FL=1
MSDEASIELSDSERADLMERMEAIRRRRVTDADFGLQIGQLRQALALADDVRADGAKLSTAQYAHLVTMLYGAGDDMVDTFATIKAAGRTRASAAPFQAG